jgi:hypothetical protein
MYVLWRKGGICRVLALTDFALLQKLTQELIVGTGVTCSAYHENHLFELGTSAKSARPFKDMESHICHYWD